ncbi:hypothetical protein RYH73_16230 [Olivibacter sp. CPCC 100613]|uniref:hypothetical protein n=1 Tax=Olivibacter sp. CPCC 100613 TaxID=3079931 RepID=UPI002FFB38B6
MDYVIQLLEREKKELEVDIRQGDLMHKNMKQATQYFKNISELKRAIKVLRAKARGSD